MSLFTKQHWQILFLFLLLLLFHLFIILFHFPSLAFLLSYLGVNENTIQRKKKSLSIIIPLLFNSKLNSLFIIENKYKIIISRFIKIVKERWEFATPSKKPLKVKKANKNRSRSSIYFPSNLQKFQAKIETK